CGSGPIGVPLGARVKPRPAKTGGRRKLLFLGAFPLSPAIAPDWASLWLATGKRLHYGQLPEARPGAVACGTRPAGARPAGSRLALKDLRGRWLLLVVTAGECDEACLRALYATRQARAMQGREQDRVLRVWLQPADASALARDVLALHPGLVAARANRNELA